MATAIESRILACLVKARLNKVITKRSISVGVMLILIIIQREIIACVNVCRPEVRLTFEPSFSTGHETFIVKRLMFYCSAQLCSEFKLQYNCETFFQLNEGWLMV